MADMLNLYRQMLAYRKNSPALKWGSYQPILGVPQVVFAYLRQDEGANILYAL